MAVSTDTLAGAWAAKAQVLAEWTAAHMVNRTDQWAQYLPPEQRSYSRIVRIAPPKQLRGQTCLTTDLLARHYVGDNVGHLIGLHAKGVDNSARWISIDLGQHDPSAMATPAANLKAALAWYDTLKEQGFHPILEDSSGRGDYHLWVIFGDKVDAGTAWVFARTLVSNYADLSLPVPPKVYPRRAQVESASFKDWVRLPGRHHSHNHWSRIWDGGRWLEGADAANAILQTRIDPGHFSLRSAVPPPQVTPPDITAASVEEQVTEVFQLPPVSASLSGWSGQDEAAVAATPTQAEPDGASASMPPVPGAGSPEDDLIMIIRAWPSLPPVVKSGIVAMVRSAQTHRGS